MAFSSLTATQKVSVLLTLAGGPRYIAQMTGASAATARLGGATRATGLAMGAATRRTYLMNQALFTLHRYAFLATTVVIGLAAGLVKLGFSYLSAMDQARAALTPLFAGHVADLNKELQQLFTLSKYSPFVLSDMTTAFRKMLPAFRSAGLSTKEINRLMKAMVDTLSFAGKTTPAALQQISYAFQHMFFQGRLTGRLIQQLASAGVNVHKILGLLGVQGQDVSKIARLNISPEKFTKAFLAVSNLPGVRGAAQRLALHSFAGALQVMRDSLSQFMGLFLSGTYQGGKNELIRLVGPGGPLDKLINIQKTQGNKAALFEFSKMITGGTGLAKGLQFLGKLIKDLGNFFIHIWIPSLVKGTAALVIFYPPLKLLDAILVFLNHHARIAKVAFTLMAGAFLIAYTRALLLWGAERLLAIATFNIWKVVLSRLLPAFAMEAAALVSSIALWWGIVTATYAQAGALEAVKVAIFSLPIVGWLLLLATVIVTLMIKWKGFRVAVIESLKAVYNAILDYLVHPIERIINAMDKLLGHGILKFVLGTTVPGSAVKLVSGIAHHFAAGGVMPITANALVGEHGPEVVKIPQGATITPISQSRVDYTSITSGADDRPIVVQLHVNRRVLAEEVARANQDKLARR